MKAIWNNQVIAETDKDELIYIEGNWYFPPRRVSQKLLMKSSTPYTCYWKGDCQYFTILVNDEECKDCAWTYPKPLQSALDMVKKNFSNYIAFWHGVQVTE